MEYAAEERLTKPKWAGGIASQAYRKFQNAQYPFWHDLPALPYLPPRFSTQPRVM